MKVIAYFAAAMLALGGAFAQGQAIVTSGGSQVVVPGRSVSSHDYPWGDNRSSTPSEGYGRGLAAVIRAQGEYNLNTSAAAVNLTQAEQQEIENQKRWTQAYFEIRDINRQAFEADVKRHRGNPEDWIRIAQAGKPKRLSPSQLDIVTGEIHWPILLTASQYGQQRVELAKAFSDRAYHGVMGAETFLKVLQLTEDMLSNLKSRVRDLPSDQYVAAKRFIESLAYEASQPAG
jgi:hypothetical protein